MQRRQADEDQDKEKEEEDDELEEEQEQYRYQSDLSEIPIIPDGVGRPSQPTEGRWRTYVQIMCNFNGDRCRKRNNHTKSHQWCTCLV